MSNAQFIAFFSWTLISAGAGATVAENVAGAGPFVAGAGVVGFVWLMIFKIFSEEPRT